MASLQAIHLRLDESFRFRILKLKHTPSVRSIHKGSTLEF